MHRPLSVTRLAIRFCCLYDRHDRYVPASERLHAASVGGTSRGLVNGKPITQTEFDNEWNDLPEATKARYEKEGGKQVFLKELVDQLN